MELDKGGGRGRNLSNRYRVRRISVISLRKFGCLLGALVGCLPSLIVGCIGMLLVGGLRQLLESWQGASIHILGQEIPIDVISLLNLGPLLHTVQEIDGLSWALLILFVTLGSASGALVLLVMGNLLGWVYNFIAAFSGGLEVELRELPPPPRPGGRGPAASSRIKG